MNREEKYQLTKGALQIIMRGGIIEQPIVQILGCKRIVPGTSEKERYRILLSDGLHHITYAMISMTNSELPFKGEIENNSVVKLKQYITSVINNAGKGDTRVLVVLAMEIIALGSEVGGKIGDTVQLPEDNSTVNDTRGSSSNGTRGLKSAPSNNSSDVSMMDQSSLQDQLTHPIASLSPYQNKWIIKARVSNKSQIRTWSNSRGEGKLFSIDFIDESGEIRATIFRELVDKYYDFIEVDKVYYISKCQLKMANKQFNALKNDYEMTFTNETMVQECLDSVASIPKTQFDFVTIDKIAHIETGTLVDVIGVCKSTSDVQTFQSRNSGRELKKRDVMLVDQTNNAITLTLWGNDAENFNGSSNPVIAVKGAKVGEFGGGKNIALFSTSVMKISPDIPESFKLRGWFDNGGMQEESVNISARSGVGGGLSTQWLSFKQVQEQNLGNADKGDYYQVVGTILLMRSENLMYKACPTEECNKKLIDHENGMYRCEKCNREFPNFKYRLVGSVNVADWSGNQWISMFSSEVEKVLGMTAQQVGEEIEKDSSALQKITDATNFKQFVFKCRIKTETYNDEARLKTVALKIDPVDYKEHNAQLISRIQQLTS